MDGAGVVNGIAKEPPCKQVAEWLLEVYTMMPEKKREERMEEEWYEWV